ncbi:PAP2 family protein [Thomasclavelia cocleata]|uniref:Undecaprenyl-diphosphatase n=1 Tax=Thomasclavelia cocleata TaxID=69824 RepID=A0A1I0H2Z5_9FIRM|nr:phosphatase PAP2 family protein [Thomasclavelia cocleata]MCR1961792.1 phosphatase PAP2 family protein [Thomasclavelia cocleata]NDO43494.1 phosphatase PAP2 family protein [Thomasclavelia cocleata]PJN80173.1 PAP2 family protein [Thomasclavelia cocleata]SET77067.1 undecaprenyl-diphosphatase [Thomasclavelia cocleata]
MGLGLIKNYRKWLFLGPLLLFIFDYYLIQNDIIRPLDMLIYQRLNSLESPVVTKAVIMITQLGSFMGIMGMILCIFIYNKKYALNCLVISFLQQIINRVLKFVVKRPRPDVIHLIEETNYSFPSGHAMAISCLYAMIIVYLYRSNFTFRYLLICLCIIVIVVVDLSRVYLGVHYFSDVAGGTLLSLSLVLFFCNNTSFGA